MTGDQRAGPLSEEWTVTNVGTHISGNVSVGACVSTHPSFSPPKNAANSSNGLEVGLPNNGWSFAL